MKKNLDRKTIQKIEKIYKKYLAEIKKLKNEQDKLFINYISRLERRKEEELRNNLNKYI